MLANLEVNVFSSNEMSKREVHRYVAFLKKRLGFDIFSVVVNFVSSEKITEINTRHLKHKYSTDIITFNYSGNRRNLDGEIFISTEDAMNNAKSFKITYKEEIYRLITHGFLHMLGFDDEDTKERKEMFTLQEKVLTEYFNNTKN